MTLKDIFSLPNKRPSDIDIYIQRLYNNLFDIKTKLSPWDFDYSSIENNRVTLFQFYEKEFDYRRNLFFYGVYFDGEPFALFYGAGRDEDDEKQAFIFNKKLFFSSISYLESFYSLDNHIDIYSFDEDISSLDCVYGHDVSKLLFNYNFDLKYKKDDLVLIKDLTELFPTIEERNILCRIIDVDPSSSFKTYILELVNYKLIPCYNKRDFKRNIFKKTDVIHWSYVAGSNSFSSFFDLDTYQQEVVFDCLYNKVVTPSFSLSYKEEALIKLI